MAVMHQNHKKNILLGQSDNALTWLIIINATVFAGLYFIQLIYQFTFDKADYLQFFQHNIQNWLTLPASLNTLASRPWTLITYMFVHDSPLGLISTLLWLWVFGYLLQDLAGNNKLFPVYLYGGAIAGVLFIAVMNLIPGLKTNINYAPRFMGGGASVIAIAVAVTALAPRYRLLPMISGGIPLWVLALVFVVIDYSTVVKVDAAFAVAHLGSGLTGFFFIQQLRKGYDWGAWMTSLVTWLDDLFNPAKKHEKQSNKQRLYYKATRKPYEKKTEVTQQRVDELLDKINQQGYHMLTDEEKIFLKKASEQDINK